MDSELTLRGLTEMSSSAAEFKTISGSYSASSKKERTRMLAQTVTRWLLIFTDLNLGLLWAFLTESAEAVSISSDSVTTFECILE